MAHFMQYFAEKTEIFNNGGERRQGYSPKMAPASMTHKAVLIGYNSFESWHSSVGMYLLKCLRIVIIRILLLLLILYCCIYAFCRSHWLFHVM